MDYYKLLNVEKNASDQDIKKAYRKMAVQHHPDKTNGDDEMFKKINTAYEVLNDPEKRKIYDVHGEEGLSNNGNGGMSSNMGGIPDIFKQMFSGGFGGFGGGGFSFSTNFGGNRSQQVQRGQDVQHNVNITLQEAYTGTQRKLRMTRKKICPKCTGTGSKSGKNGLCTGCNGNGNVTITRQVGPGMIQQSVSICSNCGGSGKKVDLTDQCDICAGTYVVLDTIEIDINISPSVNNGETKVFEQKSNEYPNTIPGNLIIVINIQTHPEFVRKENNLLYDKYISLHEALTGTTFIINHLDDRKLIVDINKIIKPNDKYVIKGEGMKGESAGDLIITFYVIFPDKIDNEDTLATVLPPKPIINLPINGIAVYPEQAV
jgi:DnaJ family protein A protein 2